MAGSEKVENNSRTKQIREQIENRTPQIPPKTVLYDAARGQKNQLLSSLVGNNGLEVRVLPGSPNFSSSLIQFPKKILRSRAIWLSEIRGESPLLQPTLGSLPEPIYSFHLLVVFSA